MARTELAIFKIARDLKAGDIRIETEQIASQSVTCRAKLKWRVPDDRYSIVLSHLKTGTLLVAK
jgi:hypothetical protein